jgi:hypothetical protein
MFNIFVRAVIFGLGVEIGRDIYRKVKQKTIEREESRSPEQVKPTASHDDDSNEDEPEEGVDSEHDGVEEESDSDSGKKDSKE